MNGLVCRWVGGRVEPNGGDAGHAAPDEIVGLVLELVEPADRHRRIAGHRGFHTEPVPEPAHPDGLDIVDTRHGPDGLFRAVEQGRVDAIQQAPADARAVPDSSKNRGLISSPTIGSASGNPAHTRSHPTPRPAR